MRQRTALREVSLDAILRTHRFHYTDRPFKQAAAEAMRLLESIRGKIVAVGIEDTLCARIPVACLANLPHTPAREPHWVMRPFASLLLHSLLKGSNYVKLWTRLSRDMLRNVPGHDVFQKELAGSEFVDMMSIHDKLERCNAKLSRMGITRNDATDIACGNVRTPSFAGADYLVDTHPAEAQHLRVYELLGGQEEARRTILVPPCKVDTPSDIWEMCYDRGLLDAASDLARRVAQDGSNPKKMLSR